MKPQKTNGENYLNGNENGITIDERDAMRKFLIEHGAQEEVHTKLVSLFDTNILAYEALLKEVKSKRSDIQPPNFETGE